MTSRLGSHAWEVSHNSTSTSATSSSQALIGYLSRIGTNPAIAECKRALAAWTAEALARVPSSAVRIVEVGSGLGDDLIAAHALLADNESALGLEPNADLCSEAVRRNVSAKVRFETARGEQVLRFVAPASVAVIRIERVLQHLPIEAVHAILSAAAQALHDDGVLICCEPNWLGVQVAISADADENRLVTRSFYDLAVNSTRHSTAGMLLHNWARQHGLEFAERRVFTTTMHTMAETTVFFADYTKLFSPEASALLLPALNDGNALLCVPLHCVCFRKARKGGAVTTATSN